MTNKEYLKQYKTATREARQIQNEIEELRTRFGTQGIDYDGMPKGTEAGDLSDYAVVLDRLERRLQKQLVRRLKIREEITRRIEKQEFEIDRVILRMRYLSLLEWEEIALEMDCSTRHVFRMHGTALSRFK